MIRRPPRSTRTATLFPYTTLFRSGDALAQLLALLADHNRRASGELGGPVRDSAELTPHRAGNPTRVGSKILVGSDIDDDRASRRSEEHTSELQSLMRISYAVFCLKKTQKI